MLPRRLGRGQAGGKSIGGGVDNDLLFNPKLFTKPEGVRPDGVKVEEAKPQTVQDLAYLPTCRRPFRITSHYCQASIWHFSALTYRCPLATLSLYHGA